MEPECKCKKVSQGHEPGCDYKEWIDAGKPDLDETWADFNIRFIPIQRIADPQVHVNPVKLVRICNEVSTKGFENPIVVKCVGGYYYVLTGKMSYYACKKLGYKILPCQVVADV